MSRPPRFPDLTQRKKHYDFLKARAQAKLRGEPFELTIEEWFELWTDDLFLKRGKSADSLSMTRINPKQGWRKDNVMILRRADQLAYVVAETMKVRHGLS